MLKLIFVLLLVAMLVTLAISFSQLIKQGDGISASRKAGRWLWVRLSIALLLIVVALVIVNQDDFVSSAPWASQQVHENE